MRFLILLSVLFLVGCTDTDIASLSAYGSRGEIKCYSGGVLIFDGESSGRIQTVKNSDGWEFKDDKTGKFIRVSGTCIIKN